MHARTPRRTCVNFQQHRFLKNEARQSLQKRVIRTAPELLSHQFCVQSNAIAWLRSFRNDCVGCNNSHTECDTSVDSCPRRLTRVPDIIALLAQGRGAFSLLMRRAPGNARRLPSREAGSRNRRASTAERPRKMRCTMEQATKHQGMTPWNTPAPPHQARRDGSTKHPSDAARCGQARAWPLRAHILESHRTCALNDGAPSPTETLPTQS